MLFLLLIQMFPQLLSLVAIYLIVLRIGEVVPSLGLNTLTGARARLPGRSARREHLADEGVLRHDPARSSTSPPASTERRRRRSSGASSCRSRRPCSPCRPLLVRLHAERVRDRERRCSKTTNSDAAARPAAASSTSSTASTGGRSPPACCSPRSRPCSCSRSCSAHRRRVSRRAPSRDDRGPGVAAREPHHDGSDACVPERPDELGGEAVVRLRVPRGAGTDRSRCATSSDGEPRGVAAVDRRGDRRRTSGGARRFPVWNPSTRYRWLARGRRAGYAWLNGPAPSRTTSRTPTTSSSRSTAGGPDWHLGSVVYEIFPDRFAASGAASTPPDWAVRRELGRAAARAAADTQCEWFGGDLPGIEQRLDHIESLGANVALPDARLPGRAARTATTRRLRRTSTRCSAATRRSPR